MLSVMAGVVLTIIVFVLVGVLLEYGGTVGRAIAIVVLGVGTGVIINFYRKKKPDKPGDADKTQKHDK